MKQFLITSCILLMMLQGSAQNIIDKHFSTYKAQDNFTNIHIASKAFEMSAYLEFEDEDEDFEELQAFLATVKSFDMIAGREVESAQKKYQAALKKVQATHDELMTVSEHKGTFTFLIDESNGIVKELVMVGNQENNLAIFSLTGNMDLQQLSKMSNLLDAAAEAPLEKIFESGLHDIKVYPNPVSSTENVQIEVPDDLNSAQVSLFNMNGVNIKSFQLNSSKGELETKGLSSGNYILEFKKDEYSIKKKIIIR